MSVSFLFFNERHSIACNPGFNGPTTGFLTSNHKGDLPVKGALQHKGYYGGEANVSGDAKPKSP